jgi:hypothetical protein
MSHHEPPVPDYDGMSAADVESRARAMDQQGVLELLDYERSHANRVQIIQMLEHRVEMLRSGKAEPSGGDPQAASTGAAGQPGGSPVTPETQGPPQNPPRHGAPGNPTGPR